MSGNLPFAEVKGLPNMESKSHVPTLATQRFRLTD